MADNEREYWLAGGEDKAKADAFIEERGAALVAMTALAKKYGADQYTVRGPYLSGLCFPDDKGPEGWRDLGRMTIDGKFRSYFFPSRKTKALKAIAADLTSVRAKGASEFTGIMGGPTVMRAGGGFGMRILYMAWEWVGDDLLLTVPIAEDETQSTFQPNGSRRLKMSEYWAMQEAHAEAAA